MKIVVLPGDGIGPKTMAATVDVLQAASRRFGLALELDHDIAGHESHDFKDEAKGEINPSKFFRKSLDLYANIRPARTYPGAPRRI